MRMSVVGERLWTAWEMRDGGHLAMTPARDEVERRALDLAAIQAVLEADAPRVDCPTHGRSGAVGSAPRRAHVCLR